MKIENIEIICLSEWDNQPIKNKLPKELKERLRTENQWLERRRRVKEGAVGYNMHSNSMNKKLCTYYLESQTEKMTGEVCCATCAIKTGRYCPVMSTHVSMTHKCSEWCD